MEQYDLYIKIKNKALKETAHIEDTFKRLDAVNDFLKGNYGAENCVFGQYQIDNMNAKQNGLTEKQAFLQTVEKMADLVASNVYNNTPELGNVEGKTFKEINSFVKDLVSPEKSKTNKYTR